MFLIIALSLTVILLPLAGWFIYDSLRMYRSSKVEMNSKRILKLRALNAWYKQNVFCNETGYELSSIICDSLAAFELDHSQEVNSIFSSSLAEIENLLALYRDNVRINNHYNQEYLALLYAPSKYRKLPFVSRHFFTEYENDYLAENFEACNVGINHFIYVTVIFQSLQSEKTYQKPIYLNVGSIHELCEGRPTRS